MTSLLKKPLYFDSSAILCWFFGEEGSTEMDMLHNKRINFAVRLISSIVKQEVENRIIEEINNPKSSHTKKQLQISLVKKLDGFIIVKPKGQGIEAENYQNKLIKTYKLKKRDKKDAGIVSHLIYLHYRKGSKPLIVSCDNKMCRVVKGEGYEYFNPKTQKYSDYLFL